MMPGFTRRAVVSVMLVLMSLCLLTVNVSVIYGATITVNTVSDTLDANIDDGICADSEGKCSLRAAIMTANTAPGADSINLPSGVYSISRLGDEDLSVNGDFNILDSLQIIGAGAETTFIDANLIDSAIEIPSLNSTITFALSGVTIQNANGSGQYALKTSSSATLLLEDSIIKNNYGGVEVRADAVFNRVTFIGSRYETLVISSGSTSFLNNSLIIENSADGYWSDIVKNFGTLNVESSVFKNNEHRSSGGGALYNNGGVLRVNNSLFEGNSAVASGGAMSLVGAEGLVEITATRFINNTASMNGGAIATANSTVTITNSTFTGNQSDPDDRAFGNGGAISNDGRMTISNSTINNNTAYGDFSGDAIGGGIFNMSILKVVNSTISGNTTVHQENIAAGGGIGNDDVLANADTELINVTITGNTADYGGGVYAGIGKLSLANTIVSGNTASVSGADCNYYNNTATVTSIGNNLVGEDTVCGAFTSPGDQLGVNPLLSALANNGGSTQTHALLDSSPAINSANTAVCPPTDQRNAVRVGNCDIGAFEYGGNTPVATPTTTPSDPNNLVLNGGFENTSLANWTPKNTDNDKVKCNKIKADGTQKIFARTGNCAFRFKASLNSKLIQKLNTSAIPTGLPLTLQAWVEAKNLTSSASVIVKSVDQNQISRKAVLTVNSGSYAYTQASSTLEPAPTALSSIKLTIKISPGSGSLLIDDVSLQPVSAGILPLPG
jgi:CSLREA domain-containing protein